MKYWLQRHSGHVFSLSPEKHLALFTHIQCLHHSYLRSPLTWFKNNSLISVFFWLLTPHSWLKIPFFSCNDLLLRNLRRVPLTQTCDLLYSVMVNSVLCQKSNVHSCWKVESYLGLPGNGKWKKMCMDSLASGWFRVFSIPWRYIIFKGTLCSIYDKHVQPLFTLTHSKVNSR